MATDAGYGSRHQVEGTEIGRPAFYEVKLLFPRGDATSLPFGFNAKGEITAVGITSMAGD